MKYIKTFEDLKETLQIGDYVLINIDIKNSLLDNRYEIMNFINNTIGRIGGIREDRVDYWDHKIEGDIKVMYENVPKNVKKWMSFTGYNNENPEYNGLYYRSFDKDKVVAFAKTSEELEPRIIAKKFNI